MEIKAHFANIHKVVIDHLDRAETEVTAAIAWFTDREIYEVLCKKARSKVSVSIALIGDEINSGPSGLNFQKLRNVGGQVTFLPPGTRDSPTMHHKFCVIDRSTVITGSYNWSQKARTNDENITVVSESTSFAGKFLDTFDTILARSRGGVPVMDADAVRRRLEMIRNLILLDEQDDVASHLLKLRAANAAPELALIIEVLGKRAYHQALQYIDAYLSKSTALVTAGFVDIARLRFQLETLEVRFESLSDEKADLDRRIFTFNRHHDDALGDLIRRVLQVRAEVARMLAADAKNTKRREEAEATAQYAKAAYEDYSKQQDDLQRTELVHRLGDAAEREMKSLYRKACSLCHPDKVADGGKEAAHRVFTELQDAYKCNDLQRIREIYSALVAGAPLGTRSSTLGEVETLKVAIAELRFAIGRLVAELKAMQASEGARLMEAAGETETDWLRFFERQREVLEAELVRAASGMVAVRAEEEDLM